MVVALGQAGHGDRADDADVADRDREGAAVGGVLVRIQAHLGLERRAGLAGALADEQRGVAEAVDHPALARDPGVVVGGRPGQCGVEELLAVAADVDGHRKGGRPRRLDQRHAERPGRVVVEAIEDELALLGLEVVGHHGDAIAARTVSSAPYGPGPVRAAAPARAARWTPSASVAPPASAAVSPAANASPQPNWPIGGPGPGPPSRARAGPRDAVHAPPAPPRVSTRARARGSRAASAASCASAADHRST